MKIGIYAGSFNPFHKGHQNIYEQAKSLFDLVILAIGKNPEKSDIPTEKRTDLPVSHVVYYEGLLTDLIKRIRWEYGRGIDEVFLIRGLRNGDDLAYEQNQLRFMKEMLPELKVIFLVCDPQFSHLSSTVLRNLRKYSEAEYLKYAA